MKTAARLFVISSWSVAFLALGVLVAGCNDRSKPQFLTRSGKITDVDLTAKQATLEFVRKKDGKIIPIRGQASSDTKLTINGRLADLKEVRIGDPATITGYYDINLNIFLATVIEVTRPDESATASQPATVPAN